MHLSPFFPSRKIPFYSSRPTLKTILIIEDDIPTSAALKQAIAAAGFKVTTATDSIIGLNLALEEKPNLIICDLMMPGLDGKDLINKIRSDKWGSNVPIIILTNLDISQDLGFKKKVTALLVKAHHTLSDVVDKVKNILKHKP